jgi:hypothetical protein
MLARWGFFSLAVGLAAAGCAAPAEKIHLTEGGAADFQQLNIVYDANSVGGLAVVIPPSSVQQAGHSEIGKTDPAPPSKRVRLEVRYPYPGLHEDFVHVTLRAVPVGSTAKDSGLSSRTTGLQGFSNANSRGGGLLSLSAGPPPAPVADPDGECLVLDMPKTELTAVFLELAGDGYFKNPAVQDGATHLEVTYNEGQVEKVWNREPRLEQLVDLLKRHGSPATKPQEEPPRPGYYTARYGRSPQS